MEDAGAPAFPVMGTLKEMKVFLWFKPRSITLKQGEGGGDVEGEVLSCEIESNGTRVKRQHQQEVVGGSHSSPLSHETAWLPRVWFPLLLRK